MSTVNAKAFNEEENQKKPEILEKPEKLEKSESLKKSGRAEKKPRNLRYLWLYAVGIFSTAMVLMLLSFLSQARMDNEKAREELLAFSVSTRHDIDELKDENALLKEENNDILWENRRIKGELTEATGESKALAGEKAELEMRIAELEARNAEQEERISELRAVLYEITGDTAFADNHYENALAETPGEETETETETEKETENAG